jgi:hypothetical protein
MSLISEGHPMAIDTSGGHKAMDYPEHLRTYSAFLRGTAVLMAIVVLLLLWMLIFLVP